MSTRHPSACCRRESRVTRSRRCWGTRPRRWRPVPPAARYPVRCRDLRAPFARPTGCCTASVQTSRSCSTRERCQPRRCMRTPVGGCSRTTGWLRARSRACRRAYGVRMSRVIQRASISAGAIPEATPPGSGSCCTGSSRRASSAERRHAVDLAEPSLENARPAIPTANITAPAITADSGSDTTRTTHPTRPATFRARGQRR